MNLFARFLRRPPFENFYAIWVSWKMNTVIDPKICDRK